MSANDADSTTNESIENPPDPDPLQSNHNEPDPVVPDDAAPELQNPDTESTSDPIPEINIRNETEKGEKDDDDVAHEQQNPEAENAAEKGKDDDDVAAAESSRELKKDEGSRTFTMRELLNEVKTQSLEETQTTSPYSREATQQQIEENNAAMDLINSVTGADEESRSRQKILTFAARRYASAIERNPDDYDALYNWALVLQESADNVGPESGSSAKDALLEEACKKYEEATRLCPTLHDAFYNRAIAISDRAKMRGRTKEAEELWKQATYNYERAVQLNWNTPQALNNWGLALQELSAIVPAREKQTIVKAAINKFRGAISLQFDFHRAIYNLGTVLYGLAEDISRMGGSGSVKDVSPDELYSLSAIYIAAAHALKPSYSVYTSALKLVRSMLPLPYLKVGYLTAPPLGNPVAPHSDWKRTQFVLDNEGLQQIHRIEQNPMSQNLSGRSGDTLRPAIKVDVADIVSVSACADLTLPPGAALCIDTVNGPVYLIADSWESLDGWLDAIRIVYTIFARGKSDVLAGIVTG